MEIRPKMKDYDRETYDPQKHLHDLIAWAEKAETKIKKLETTTPVNIDVGSVGGSFKFAKYVNGYYEYADNTEKGDMYNNVVTGSLMTEKQIFDEWLKLNYR